MIPKIIHYCWFGKGLMPKSQKDCIKSWQKIMPDYKIMRWDETNFDVEKYAASKYANKVKKYALTSDVCRYNVLYEYGGIYLDTDVEVFKKFDDYLDADFFSAVELYNEFYTENSAELLDENGNPKVPGMEIPHLEMLTSTMGCVPGQEMIGLLRDYYNNIEADEEYATNYRKYVNNDRLVAKYAAKYGFKYKDEKQLLENNMVIYPTGIFGHAHCPNPNFEVTYHYNAATWNDSKSKAQKRKILFDKLHLMWLYNAYKKVKAVLKK
jgi:hypothetical protein